MRPSRREASGFLNRSLRHGRAWKIPELGRGVIPSLRRHDVKVVTAGPGQLARLRECGLRGLAPVNQLAVLAHRSDSETHFFFFFFFRFSTSAWARKASARDLIWPATKESAVWVATRSAVTACFRMAFVIPIRGQFSGFEVVPADEARATWVEAVFTAGLEYCDITTE